jgi:hypothetical protein
MIVVVVPEHLTRLGVDPPDLDVVVLEQQIVGHWADLEP